MKKNTADSHNAITQNIKQLLVRQGFLTVEQTNAE